MGYSKTVVVILEGPLLFPLLCPYHVFPREANNKPVLVLRNIIDAAVQFHEGLFLDYVLSKRRLTRLSICILFPKYKLKCAETFHPPGTAIKICRNRNTLSKNHNSDNYLLIFLLSERYLLSLVKTGL